MFGIPRQSPSDRWLEAAESATKAAHDLAASFTVLKAAAVAASDPVTPPE